MKSVKPAVKSAWLNAAAGPKTAALVVAVKLLWKLPKKLDFKTIN
jgi:hypothetical protein